MAVYQDKPDLVQQLKQQIKEKNLARLYFFHGEEVFLLHHYLEQMRKLLIDELTESFNFHKLNSETFDMRTFADAVENLPMMAEHTMVCVDEIDVFKLTEPERDKLIGIFSDIPEYCTVVFTYETTEWKPDKRLKKLWECINTYGTIVQFDKQSQRDLVAWVTRHFAANKKRISPDLCAYLIEITGGTMTALSGEIGKICAFSGADTIVKSDIDAVTEPILDAVAFQMTDYLAQGAYGPALVKLQQLLKMQQDPILVLGAIGSHFRRLSAARILRDNGKQASELKNYMAMSDYAAKKTMSAAQKFPASFYACAMEIVLETDHQIKTSYDDAQRLLELLVLRLAQEARHA